MRTEAVVGLVAIGLILLALLWSATKLDNQIAIEAVKCEAAGGVLVTAYRGYACINRRLP